LVRPAGLQDIDALVRIEELCFDRGRFRQDHLRWILTNERAVTLVEDNGSGLTGVLMLLFEGRVCRVLSVAVVPDARRRGLGTRLMQIAEDVAMERGCASVRLEVSTRNLAAIELYRGLDYKLDGHLPRYYSWGEDAFSMHKPVREATPASIATRAAAVEDSTI